MSRVLGLTVGRNEERRYLKPMLEYMKTVLDRHFFYDDWSTDNTPVIAKAAGCRVFPRAETTPSFLENEGAFRAGAWEAFELCMNPQPNDWVLVIDCDEVLVTTIHDAECSNNVLGLRTKAWLLHNVVDDLVGIDLNIPEVFGYDPHGRPLERTDKLWGTIHAPRLFQYRPGGSYVLGDFGVPAVPSYVMGGRWGNTDVLALMHYGYASRRDQENKYARYVGKVGHSNNHVDSIMDIEKKLVPWQGPYVEAMKPWIL
jgi:hypothetical protein